MSNRIVASHPFLLRLILLTVASLLTQATATETQAQTPGLESSKKCVTDNTKPEGLPLRTLTIKARGGRVPPISALSPAEPILVVDERYTASRLTATIEAVNRALKKDRENVDEALVGGGTNAGGENKTLGVIAVIFITSCTRIDAGVVDVDIIPYYLRLERTKVGNLILPIPRSNRPTVFTQTPRPLLAFNPKFGGSYDKKYGFTEKAEITTNLLRLGPMLSDEKLPAEGKTRLNLHLMGQKSIENPFYDSDATLSLKRVRPGKVIESVSLEAGFSANQQPWGEGTHLRNAGSLQFALEANPEWGMVRKISTNVAYSYSRNRFSAGDGQLSEVASEHSFEGRAIIDGRLAGGLVRLGVWADASSPNSDSTSYRRVAALLGYQKEIALSLNRTLGVEGLFGYGRAAGVVPEYARFYAGNSLSSFLYDQPTDPSLTSFPTGPLLRSFGKGEGGERTVANRVLGGTSFWHLNLNVAIPIPGSRFSRPLIPAEVVDEDLNVTLKDVIKNQMNTAEVTLSSDLQDGGLREEDANKEAKRIVAEVRPAVNFIADQANILAIKPLLLFDSANLRVPDTLNNRTRYGIGAGLQLTIVVAKFEAGYMRTVRSLPGDRKGNFLMRIVFQNLF